MRMEKLMGRWVGIVPCDVDGGEDEETRLTKDENKYPMCVNLRRTGAMRSKLYCGRDGPSRIKKLVITGLALASSGQ